MMSVKKFDPQFLRNLPALIEQAKATERDRLRKRTDLIQRRRAAQEAFETNEQTILAKAQPIEDRIAQVRAELQKLEQKLAPLADARISATFSHNQTLRTIRAELRQDAFADVHAFQLSIDNLRSDIQGNWNTEHFSALKSFRSSQPMQARIAAAMALTLDVYKRADRIAVEADDVVAALRELREELAAEGLVIN